MLKINITPQNRQTVQFLPKDEAARQMEPFIHAGSFRYVSWVFVKENIFFPARRCGASDIYIYIVGQYRFSGDSVDGVRRFKEGDMLIMKSGAAGSSVVRNIGPKFKAFEFWLTDDRLMNGAESVDYMKYHSNQFPILIKDDVLVRSIFGEDAAADPIVGLNVKEVILPPDTLLEYAVDDFRMIGIYVVKGKGFINGFDYNDGDAIEIVQSGNDNKNIIIDSKADYSTHIILFDMENE